MSCFMYLASAIASLGGLSFGYSNGIISGLLQNPAFRHDFGITLENETNLSGSLASALQLGGLCGVVFQSSSNDLLGRKTTSMLMMILYLIGGTTQLYAEDIFTFLIGRFLAGFALSIWTVSVTLYNTEIATPESRGQIIGIQQLSAAFGMTIGYWLNFVIKSAKLEYETALAGQVFIGILSIMLFAILPESPRWYIMTHQAEAATRALSVMRNEDHDTEEEIRDIVKDYQKSRSSPWQDLFSQRNRKKLQVCLLFVFFQQFTGQNLLFYYAPQLFRDLGLSENELLATGFLGLVKFLMTIPSLLVIDNLGRRPLMIIGTGIMFVSFLYIGIYNTLQHSNFHHYKLSTQGFGLSFFTWLEILCIYIFIGGYSISWGVIRFVLPAETFDQSTRAKANTLCQLIDWTFQMIVIKLSPYLLDLLQGQIYFLFSFLLFCFLCWLWYLPETKSVLLEDMDSVYNNQEELPLLRDSIVFESDDLPPLLN